MSNFNKVVTNLQQSLSNAENDNLSQTLSAVRTAGGGGGGGTSYGGDGIYIEIVGNNTITLTTTAAEKLNREIPTTVAELTDSGDYATKDFADAKYQTKDSMSAYLTTANAASTYQTKSDMSAYWTSAETNAAFAEEISTLVGLIDGKQSKLTFSYDNDKISAINGSALAGQSGITGDYYSASNPSGFINSTQAETQILEKHYLTEASGDLYYLPIPSELLEGTQYAYTTQGWSPIQGGGGASGISFVNHDNTLTGDGNTVKLGVDTTQIQTKLTEAEIQNIIDVTTLKTASSTWNNVSAKLNTSDFNTYTATTAPSTYQSKGDYVKNTDIGLDSNNKVTAISGKELIITAHQSLTNYYTKSETSGATELSTEFGKYALKSEIPTVPTKVSDLTDSGNYYKKSETSGATELSTEFAKYVTSSNVTTQDTDYVMTTTGWKVLTLPGGGMTQVIHDETLTGQGNDANSKLGVVWSALSGNTIDSAKSAYWAVKAKTNDGQHEYTIGSELLHLNTITQYLDGWAETIIGDKGIEIIDTNDDSYPDTFQLTQTAYNAVTSVSSKLDTTAFSTVSGTFLTKSSADNDYAPKSVTATVNTLTAASAGWNNKVDKPTSLVNKYLVLRTDSNGDVSGWYDLQGQSYSKSEADRTFVATANIDTTTLSGDGKSVSTKLGVKTDVIATRDYVNSSFLPLSGGEVSGDVIIYSSGTNLLTVNTTANLIGQSRVANLTDTTAIGTNWMGVNSFGGGFLKNVQGGNVGALNGTSIQIDFAPNGNTAYGNITVNSQGNSSKIVHIPTASYDSMSSFDATNGPNYMLRKTASGFDIGACVINVQSLPAQTEANTYYFIYDN